jgi:Calx-beta domain/FG-GAP-like repeat/Domain of unknown function (DUF4214)
LEVFFMPSLPHLCGSVVAANSHTLRPTKKPLVKRLWPRVFVFICLLEVLSVASYAVGQCSDVSLRVAGRVPAGTSPAALVARDFNGDGHLDLAVANNNSDDVSILLGDGAKGFSPPTSYRVGMRPHAIAAGDFNGDGNADLVTTNPLSDNISVLLGAGAGTLGSATDYATDDEPYGLAVGDFNGDSLSDIAVGSAGGSNRVAILLSDRLGGFSPVTPVSVVGRAYTIILGKFDGDSWLDMAVRLDNRTAVFFGNGLGGFSAASPPEYDFGVMATGDFNGDGKADLVGGKNFNEGISIALGDGAGHFLAQVVSLTGASHGIAVGDFNGDGKSDVAALDGSPTAFILFGDGTGQLGAPTRYGVGNWPTAIVSTDFDRDGKLDLAVASREDAVVMLYGMGGGEFYGALDFKTDPRPNDIVHADFNRDGKDDLAVANTDLTVSGSFPPLNVSSVSILLGDGAGRMVSAPAIQFQTDVALTGLVSADFNDDGKADLAASSFINLTDEVDVLLGNGDGTFAAPVKISLGSYGIGANHLETADVNRDGLADIVVAFFGSGNFVSLLGAGNGSFTIAAGNRVTDDNFFEKFAVADFNQDANPDLAYVRYQDKTLTILFGDGTGYFNTRRDHTLVGSPFKVIAHDFNRDGKADVAFIASNVTANLSEHFVSIRLGDGAGNFGPATNFEVGEYPQELTAGDLNGDSFIDLAVSNGLSMDVSILTGDGAGGFGLSVPFAVGGYPNSAVISDFNRDGKADLAVSRTGANSIGILLNDSVAPRPCVSVDDVTVTEGDAGASNATFNVTLSEPSAETVRVNFRVAPRPLFNPQDAVGVTSTAGVDYQPVSGTLTFAPGTTTQTISVPVNGDTTDEYDEAFSVLLSSPANAAIHDPLGVGTILDDDAQPTITINDSTVLEGNDSTNAGTMTFTVTLSAASGKPITLFYQTADGTATGSFTEANDYIPANRELYIPQGTTTRTFTVAVRGDTDYEPDETFFVNINSSTATVADAQAQGTIVNDDPQPTIFVAPYASVEEGNLGFPNLYMGVSLSNASTQTITVNYATTDGTARAGSDYAATSGSLTFSPGEKSKLVKVPVIDDEIEEEFFESFTFTLSGATNATIQTPSAEGTITDNDGPNISVNSISITEGDFGTKTATFTVSLSRPSPFFISVSFGTGGGTATGGSDYRVVNQRVGISPGHLSTPVLVQITGDTFIEPDEFFQANIFLPTGGKIINGLGTGTILNDDSAGVLRFSAASYSADEGTALATFIVERVGGRTGVVTAHFTASDGTATARSDYNPSGFPATYAVTFQDGETSRTLAVPIIDDALVEGPETINLTLTDPFNTAVLGSPTSAVMTIQDNDPSEPQAPTLQFGQPGYSLTENGGRVSVLVSLTGGNAGGVSVDYRTVDADTFTVSCADTANNHGAAFARCDFATTVGRLDFAAGETQKTINVPVINDGHDEAAETFQIVLSNASGGAVLGATSGTTVTIQDDDPAGAANPILTTPFFVRQHYLDFLSREPEANEPWSAILNGCANAFNLDAASPSAACDRLIVSQSFFGSPEFRVKGFSVFRFYKLAFNRLPEYTEIASDMSFVAGATEAEVYARKAQLANAFAQRPEFTNAYGGLSDSAYVEALFGRYGLTRITTPDPQQPDGAAKLILTPSDLTTRLSTNTLTRGQVLRAVADSDEVGAREFDNAFVAMQYYGYLRRKPETAGYEAWLAVLRRGDIRAMVNGFMNSAEYKLRFGSL